MGKLKQALIDTPFENITPEGDQERKLKVINPQDWKKYVTKCTNPRRTTNSTRVYGISHRSSNL